MPDRNACLFLRRWATKTPRRDRKKPIKKKSIQIGKYLVSPLIKRLEDGRYAPSVSIRSGRGSATHDRVLRFVSVFDTPRAALRYATDQGMLALGLPAALHLSQP